MSNPIIKDPFTTRPNRKSRKQKPSIGIILCADKDHLDVEIALQDNNRTIGVADYQLLLPKEDLQNLVMNEIKASE